MKALTAGSSSIRTQRMITFKRQTPLMLMVLPGVALFILFNYLPMLGIFLAFKNYNYSLGMFGSEWVGLKNFEVFFNNPDAWLITRNTVLYNFGFLVLNTITSIVVSILLVEVTSKLASKIYQTISLLPHFLSFVIVGYLVFAFLSTENGVINGILKSMGLNEISWYSEPKYWPYILTIVNLWKHLGYNCIVYLAAISGINYEYYEAAFMDGAGKFKQMIYITLPCLKPTIIILTIMNLGHIFSGDFGLFYQVPMNSGLLASTTSVLSTYVYKIRNDVGMGTAVGLYQSLVGLILVLISNHVVKKISPELALY